MSNLILWAHQCTVDYNYQIRSNIANIAKQLSEKKFFPELHDKFIEICDKGLSKDRTIAVDKYSGALNKLMKIRKFLNEKKIPFRVEIGGNPAIAAIRGHLLQQGPEYTDLPLVYYTGLYPKSVEKALEQTLYFKEDVKLIKDVFHIKLPIKAEPQTIGLETPTAKLMLIYGPGRSLTDVASDGKFEHLFTLLEAILAGAPPKSRAIFAINAPPPTDIELELAKQLVEQLKASFGDQVRIFVSTRDFEGDKGYMKAICSFLEKSDIISMSEQEAEDLHTAYKGEHSDDPLAYKVRDLPFRAIKVCHSAYGVVIDLGCLPETIITSKRFQENPAGFLEEVLRLSADGATYAMDATAGLERTANESLIRIYSQNISRETRQSEKFRSIFLNVTEPMPAGMVWIASARVVRARGAVVGLGAIFDGLLLTFLMRD